MLRSLVLILLLVNGAFFAWSQGWLNELVGVKPDAQHEPQRLSLQVNQDKIVVASPAGTDAPGQAASPDPQAALGAPEGASAPSAPDAAGLASAPDGTQQAPGDPTEEPEATPAAAPASPAAAARTDTASAGAKGLCVEAGPFSPAEYASAEALLRPILPSGLWTRQTVSVQGMWLVYMGPYADAAQLDRKQDELKRIKGLDFEVVRTPPALAQGISLGRFSVRENADKQLDTLRGRGIRTARIVTLRQPAEMQLLRVARADTATQVKLSGLKLPQGKGFMACRG